MTISITFDVTALGRALEERDTDAAMAHYAEHAELRIVDASNPPSNPRVLPGRDAISEWLTDINSRDMTHRVVWSIQHEDKAALTVDCRYPDGTRVLCAATYDTANGRITSQVITQAWDS
jgi:hypothetical protein